MNDLTPCRRMTLRVSGSLLCRFFVEGSGLAEVVENPLPEDAWIVDIRRDPTRCDVIEVVLESASFPEVRPGSCYGEVKSPVFRRLDAPARPR